MLRRPRRNRKNSAIRNLVQETHLTRNDLVQPLFILEGDNSKEPIPDFPNQFRLGKNALLETCKQCQQSGIKAVALFPIIADNLKTPDAAIAHDPNGIVQQSTHAIKHTCPDLQVITDVALDPFNSDGHDGIVKNGEIANDETLEILRKVAVSQAKAGADIISASDMMDGRIEAIRNALDSAGFTSTSILSYSAKYASSLYSPFRNALDSAPKAGDKKTYQMNPANAKEAQLEAELDIQEGADILMVKPATLYLDIIHRLSQIATLPLAAYHVSGEYCLIMNSPTLSESEKDALLLESLLSIKRAGADIIFTYGAIELCRKNLL